MAVAERLRDLKAYWQRNTKPSAPVTNGENELARQDHLPATETPMPLFPDAYGRLVELHGALNSHPITEDDVPPTAVSIRNSYGEVKLTHRHTASAERQVQKLIFSQGDSPITIFHLARLQSGNMQITVRYNHNETGVLVPMSEHNEAFLKLAEPQEETEKFMAYSVTIDQAGTVQRIDASLKYAFNNGNTNVHTLPIPIDEHATVAPFIHFVVEQAQQAVTATVTNPRG